MTGASGELAIIDFHNHFVPRQFEQTAARYAPAGQRPRWQALAAKMSDESFLLRHIGEGDIAARVVNIPAAQIADADGRVSLDTIRAMNDALADLAARNKDRVHMLASVDAYEGDAAAREAERAIRDLGARGLFVECARGDLMIDAPQARPTLEVAAGYGVPVFVHPVNPQPFISRMEPYGRIGTLFARGTINSASLIALVEGGVCDELPALKVVVTALALGGLAMAAQFSGMSLRQGGAADILRRQIYIDTMGFDPALMRLCVDIVGADHVIAGSDFPIVNEAPIRRPLTAAMRQAGLTDAEQRAIAAGNTRTLLDI